VTQTKPGFRVVRSPGMRFAVRGVPSRASDKQAARDLLSRTQLTRGERPSGSVLHVVSSPKGWKVKPEGGAAGAWADRVFQSQSDAVSAATKHAKEVSSRVVIHSRNGRIRDSRSYE
jgi:hypothetical protein